MRHSEWKTGKSINTIIYGMKLALKVFEKLGKMVQDGRLGKHYAWWLPKSHQNYN